MLQPSAKAVAQYLSRRDPVLKEIIRRVGPQALPKVKPGFGALVRAIVFQQISGAAGRSIMRRLGRASGSRRLPGVGWFVAATDTALRAAGLSPQKMGYLRDLARKTSSRELRFSALSRWDDNRVLEALTSVRGVGPWTAQMYLIFCLNRPDVLAAGDLGVRKAIERAYEFRSLPSTRTIERLARPWKPYRSHAIHYLWRSLDAKPPGVR